MPLTNLTIINPTAPKPLILTNSADVLKEWNKFYATYDSLFQIDETGIAASAWREENTFLLLVNTITQEVYAIRDYGMYLPEATDFCFTTDFIPLYTHQPMENVQKLEEYAATIFSRFMSEVLTMNFNAQYPLFLLEHCNGNNYTAWSIAEKKEVYVYDYKSYLPTFSYATISDQGNINRTKNDKYTIIPPSKSLIDSLGLKLNPYLWENKMSWDKWFPRKEKKDLSSVVDNIYRDLYRKALDAINQSRKDNLGHDDAFSKLESRVARFERLSQLGAPVQIIKKEATLIQKSYDQIKDYIL